MKRTGKRTWRVRHFRGERTGRVGDRGQVVWGRGDRDFGAEGIERMGKRTWRVGHFKGERTGRVGMRRQVAWGTGDRENGGEDMESGRL